MVSWTLGYSAVNDIVGELIGLLVVSYPAMRFRTQEGKSFRTQTVKSFRTQLGRFVPNLKKYVFHVKYV